jgi:hypothetical protein
LWVTFASRAELTKQVVRTIFSMPENEQLFRSRALHRECGDKWGVFLFLSANYLFPYFID